MKLAENRHVDSSYAQSSFHRMGVEDQNNINELQQCHTLINNIQSRVRYLEDINLNLEYRLEREAKQGVDLERQIVSIDNDWKKKYENLEKDIDKIKHDFNIEKIKNERLREHLSRTERELYGILQRKYELMRGSGTSGGITGNKPSQTSLSNEKKGVIPSWEANWSKGLTDPSTLDEMHSQQPVNISCYLTYSINIT